MPDTLVELQSTVKPAKFALLQPFQASTSFTALWGGQTTSTFGDSMLNVILPLIVYNVGHSTLAMGLVMTLMMLPQVIILPFAGLLVDRAPRIRLMISTDTIRFLLLSLFAALSFAGQMRLGTIYVFAVIYGAMSGLFNPAYSAVRAQVFTPEIRNAANSLTQISQQGVRLIGPSLGGVLMSLSSASSGLAMDAVTFIVSIISLLFVHPKRQPTAGEAVAIQPVVPPAAVDGATRSRLRQFLYDLSGGGRELGKHPWLWITVVVFTFINMCTGGLIEVLQPWLVKVHLHDPAYVYGLLTSSSAVGGIVSGFVLGSRTRWRHRGMLAYSSVGIAGVGLLFMVLTPNTVLLMLCSAVTGAGIMAFGVIWEGSLQELVPEEAFGRVASIDQFGSFALMPVGYLLTGWLAQVVGGGPTYLGLAVIAIVISLGTLAIPGIRKFD